MATVALEPPLLATVASPSAPLQAARTATSTAPPTQFQPATPMTYADCGWSGVVETWVDRNGNGRWDTGEEPLPGVLILASDGRGYSQSFTGADGRVTMTSQPRGCSAPGLMVSTQWPSGYYPTTAPILPPHDYPEPYRFGFAADTPIPGTPTRTAP